MLDLTMLVITGEQERTIEEYRTLRNADDIDRAMEFFADDAVVKQIPPPPPPDPGVYTGKPQIRAWMEPQLQQFHVTSRNRQVHGDTVTWEATVSGDMFRQMGIDCFEVTAEARVQGGKITSLTLTQTPESHSKFQAAMRQASAA